MSALLRAGLSVCALAGIWVVGGGEGEGRRALNEYYRTPSSPSLPVPIPRWRRRNGAPPVSLTPQVSLTCRRGLTSYVSEGYGRP